MGSSWPRPNLIISSCVTSTVQDKERELIHLKTFVRKEVDLHISYIFLVRSSNPGWPSECNTTNFVPTYQHPLQLLHNLSLWTVRNLRVTGKAGDIPVAVRNTFPPQFSASKASNPPPPEPGVRRFVIAWIPCNVPARINTVFKGSGGSISTI